MITTTLAFSAVQTLCGALQNKELNEICSMLGYRSELEALQNTVKTVIAVLLDADAEELLSHKQLDYLEELKAVVYDADDLLDEVNALAQRHLLKGGEVSNKVSPLFSRIRHLPAAYNISKNVTKIRKELEGVACDSRQFGFTVGYHVPIRKRREETCSYVFEKGVIGREKETEEIVNMLLSPHHSDVVAIVGMGGLGKTTLAQLVYNHDKIINEFDLRLWVCVSDQDQKTLPLQPILAKILESATGKKQDGSRIELMQRHLKEVLQGKRYLLVLDDVWTEDRSEWLELKYFLMGGGSGSQILVTTRSRLTACVVGSIAPFELQGLSEENSWLLFERTAFYEEQDRRPHELVDIGKDIVKQCANVPLAIRVVGSLLYGQRKKMWLQFQQHGLAMLKRRDNSITQMLKFSYLHLHPSLKCCLAYCAIFPKDFVIKKQKLISLWMAHGFVEQLSDNQSIEDACEESFSILLQRCFFRDVEKDEFGEIVSCKMHDLVYDMTQEVVGQEIRVVDSGIGTLDKRIHHICHVYHDVDDDYPESQFTSNRIRTYIALERGRRVGRATQFPVNILLEKWKCLRVLDLGTLGLQHLSESIGNLLNLRYLDVSLNRELKKLPESLTRLQYLQTLNILGCEELKELPKNFSELVKLRLLDVEDSGLICMPSGMAKLTCLRKLSMFVVSETNSESKQSVGNLEDLRALTDLKGHLEVKIKEEYAYVQEGSRDGGYLRNKKDLNDIAIVCEGRVNGEEVLELVFDDLVLMITYLIFERIDI